MAQTLAVLDMVDAIGANGPAVVPKGTPAVAVYITGTGGVPWSAAQIAELAARGVKYVLRIDQTNAFLPFLTIKDLIVDIEPGAATNLTADHIAVRRAQAGLDTVLYVNRSNFEALVASVNALGIASHVWYWLADWSLDRNGAIGYIEQHPRTVAVQYESLSLIDKSVVRASWLEAVQVQKKQNPVKKAVTPIKRVVKKIHPKVIGAGGAGTLAALLEAYLQAHGVQLTPVELAEIPVVLGILGGIFAPNPQA